MLLLPCVGSELFDNATANTSPETCPTPPDNEDEQQTVHDIPSSASSETYDLLFIFSTDDTDTYG